MRPAGKREEKTHWKPVLFLAGLCGLLAVFLTLQVTMARYSPQEQLDMETIEISQFTTLETTTDATFAYDPQGGQTMEFTLENRGTSDLPYKLVLITTLDFGQDATISLTTQEETFQAVAQAIDEQDSWYYTTGAGYVYRFYDEDTQGEKIFTMNGVDSQSFDMNITNGNSGLVQLDIVS